MSELADRFKRENAENGKQVQQGPAADAARPTRTQEEIDRILAAHDAAQTASTQASVETIVDAAVEYPHLYSATHSEAFKIQLSSGEVQAKDGLLKLNEAQHKELQKLIASGRPDIAQNLVHLDPEAAAKVAKAHMEAMKNKRPDANRGSTHSQAAASKAFIEIKPVQIPGASDEMNNKISGEGSRMLAVEEEGIMRASDSGLSPDGQSKPSDEPSNVIIQQGPPRS